MPDFVYHFARFHGAVRQRLFERTMQRRARAVTPLDAPIDAGVFSFSGKGSLAEQVASILSFLRHAGIPRRFTVASDGSHSAEDRAFLRSIHPCVEIIEARSLLGPHLPGCILDYARAFPLGLKLAVLLSLSAQTPCIYTDSDILFFPGARETLARALSGDHAACYLLDCKPAFDPSLLAATDSLEFPTNSGFLVFREPLDWSAALARLAALRSAPQFHTEQTVVHLLMQTNPTAPLDPARCVVALDDQCLHVDRHAAPPVALRHYVAPVRHKLWLQT